ncbi:MAG: GGDEF domain-containing protein, partial [Butyrivibrio sp.]|nr:GGDEF domain-containing protein [Butyrivibrio sp.]
NLDQVIPPQDLIQLKNALFAIDPGTPGLTCFRIRISNGKLNWIAANLKKRGEAGDVLTLDMSDIQSLKSDISSAYYDEMTGLLNKQAITDFATKLTRTEPAPTFYLCMLDIDYFKNVNDTFGHLVGDEVITEVAHIIQDNVGTAGKVGRIGGDEFMLVLERVRNEATLRKVLALVRDGVEDRFRQFRGRMNITVTIGAALFPDYVQDYDSLFKLADKMLYLGKTKGRNRYIIYTPEVHGAVDASPQATQTVMLKSSDGQEKIALELNLMANFLHRAHLPIAEAIKRVLVTYGLDELFVFFSQLDESRYGIRRVDLPDGQSQIEETSTEMRILESDVFQPLYDANQTATVNFFDLKKDQHAALMQYMEENERRYLLVYRMSKSKNKGGYVVYANKRDNSRRLSVSDVLNLVYFARMIELTSVDR